MYVCLCHGFTDRQVRETLAKGPCKAERIYAELGSGRPKCGSCLPHLRGMVEDIHGQLGNGGLPVNGSASDAAA